MSLYKILSLLFIAALFSIQACGFTPVYMKENGINNNILAIEVKPINFGRAGQQMQAYLEDAFNPTGQNINFKYRISTEIDKRREPLTIEQDAEVTRYNLVLTSKFKLIDKATGNIILNDTSRIVGSYDAIGSDFATFAAEEDILARIVKESAHDIHIKVATFLSKNKE